MQGRVISIDYLRVLLAGFVVLGHSGFARDVIGDTGLAVGNSILRVAVPVFTIIAGYFLATTLRRGGCRPGWGSCWRCTRSGRWSTSSFCGPISARAPYR